MLSKQINSKSTSLELKCVDDLFNRLQSIGFLEYLIAQSKSTEINSQLQLINKYKKNSKKSTDTPKLKFIIE